MKKGTENAREGMDCRRMAVGREVSDFVRFMIPVMLLCLILSLLCVGITDCLLGSFYEGQTDEGKGGVIRDVGYYCNGCVLFAEQAGMGVTEFENFT